MPERNTGPVKPPVIDLTPETKTAKAEAPPSEPAKPAVATEAKAKPAAQATPAEKPAPFPLGAAAVAVIGGAVLGTALTYGLLTLGWLPLPGDAGRIAALESQLQAASDSNRSVLAGLGDQLGDLEGELAGKAATRDLESLKQQLAAAPSGGGGNADIAGLEADVTNLGQRLDALGNGTQDAGTAQKLADLTQRLDSLAGEVEAARTDSQAALTSLKADIADAGSNAAAQLPLLLTGLEAAFNSGQPFDAALGGIRQVAPDIEIPDRLTQLAATGLAAPEKLNTDFSAALPAMLAAIPGDPAAGWQGAAMDWLKAQLALRPAGDTTSAAPDAILARIETALSARSYAEADRLFTGLPEPVRAAAGTLPEAIAAQAEAQALLDGLRQRALAPLTGAKP